MATGLTSSIHQLIDRLFEEFPGARVTIADHDPERPERKRSLTPGAVEQILRRVRGNAGVAPSTIAAGGMTLTFEVSARPVSVGEGPSGELDREARDLIFDLSQPSLSQFYSAPNDAIEHALRIRGLRKELLGRGAHTYKTLARGRESTLEAVRQSIRRARENHSIFTVRYDDETLIPSFLFDDELLPRAEFQPVIKVLTEAGEDGWALWSWFLSPSSWLDGEIPAETITRDPDRVLRAARRRVSNAA